MLRLCVRNDGLLDDRRAFTEWRFPDEKEVARWIGQRETRWHEFVHDHDIELGGHFRFPCARLEEFEADVRIRGQHLFQEPIAARDQQHAWSFWAWKNGVGHVIERKRVLGIQVCSEPAANIAAWTRHRG